MALKSTICKAELAVADIDRGYCGNHPVTLARHPSQSQKPETRLKLLDRAAA